MDSTVYIVSGLPRSGTSMMMQVLHRGGLPVLIDHVRTADEDNPRGYFELERVKQTSDDASWVEEARGKVVKLISRLLFDLPEGKSAGVRYKIVFMRRDLDEVLRSQRKMLDHRGEDSTAGDAQMKELFVSHLEDVEVWLRSREDIEVIFVNYNRMLQEPHKGAERINRFLGGVLSLESMISMVDPALYRNRREQTPDDRE